MASAIDFEDCGIAEAVLKYRLAVPPNQRSYKWEKENVNELFDDLENAMSQTGAEYFLGTMVFIKTDKGFDVADGQQRLATTVILLAAIRDYLFNDKSQSKLLSDMRSSYLLKFDMDSDSDLPNLQLNLEDNDFFKRRILRDPDATDRMTAPDRQRESHQMIDDAAKVAKAFVSRITNSANPSHRIDRIKAWIKFVRDSARVIIVKVPTPEKAFTMFETLNDRGIRLSQVDLLKNHLYGLSSRADKIAEVQKNWAEMYGGLEAIGREDLALDYIRQLWISYYGHVTADDLYSSIKEFAKSPATAVELAGMLSNNVTQFTALLNPSHIYWQAHTDGTRRCIAVLSDNLKIDRIRPLLLSILSAFNKKDTEKAFRLCVSWAVRFLIVGGIGSGTIEKFYSATAMKVRIGTLKTPLDLAREMRKHVPNDDDFRVAFETANSSRPFYSRYYLHVLDRYWKDKGTTTQRDAALAIDDESERFDLEHVIPKKRSGGYPLDEETCDRLLNRIGNLALIEKPVNSNNKSETFEVKKPFYATSMFKWTQMMSQETTWGETEVNTRQKRLAAMAPKAWPISL